MRKLLRVAAALTTLALAAAAPAATSNTASIKNIVLVHGAFVDGSGWKAVADILRRDGFKVGIAQPPETSHEDDLAATNRVIDAQEGPVVLVGHSYGGIIITAAGNNATRRRRLGLPSSHAVYISHPTEVAKLIEEAAQ